MASAIVLDDNEEKERSKDVDSEDDDDTHTSSKSIQAESSHDSYDSDFGDSDCSVTSGLNGHIHEEREFFTDRRAGLSAADESGGTTWTDEKHSSYLDSMEAIFVQKMYDKEYCSLDVCGHSSRSSLSLDQECVESRPFYLNMRKPREIAGLITFRAPARPLSLVPSMFTSPWIQHFKSQKNVSMETGRVQDKAAQPLHGPMSTKDVLNMAATTHVCSSLDEDGPQRTLDSTYRKPDIACAMQTGEYKKQKCQHLVLSQLDILMEQQYDLEQQKKMGKHKHSEDGHEEPKEDLANLQEHRNKTFSCKNLTLLENSVLKEKQELDLSSKIKPPAIVVNGTFPRKLDQVVRSCKSVGEDACPKVSSGDLNGDEGGRCTTTSEAECLTTRSGSKTWTWGVQGPRYHAVKQTSAQAFHS